jgi:hypothetical protein
VEFKSPASVMVVCRFCKTTLLKDASSVRNLGKMSDVLEDYSPLQLGTAGRFGAHGFTLIGRIQLQYSAGFWNEWYALFDDGSNGWLSDASGQYAMTFQKTAGTTLPVFGKLLPGRPVTLLGRTYTASDVRTACCTGGEGELPFKVGRSWQAQMADFRAADGFLSLDYSDGGSPRVYVGQAVQLSDLKLQLLRNPAEIKDASGRFRGKITPLVCPSCGAPVTCVPGVTVHVVCPKCRAELDTVGPVATVLAAGASVGQVPFTLELGADASFGGTRYTVLGAMRRAESGSAYAWSEYLLYAPGRRFIWLIETGDGWQQAEVLDRWPSWDGAGHASIDGVKFTRMSEYAARVTFAAGSFNWRVSVGDEVRVTEFTAGAVRLAAEASAEELTWSRATPLALDQIRAWFGGHIHVEQQPHPPYAQTAKRVLIALFLINAIPLLLATPYTLPFALLAAAAIYLPAHYLDRLDASGQ